MLASSGWLPCVLSRWSGSCGFSILPVFRFAPVRPPHPSPLFCWESSGAGAELNAAGGCCEGFWQHAENAVQRAPGTDALRHYIMLERITPVSTAGESHVNLLSVCCLTAFLLHFFRSKSFKEGISSLFCNNAFWHTISLKSLFFFFNLFLNLLRKNSLTA